MGGVCQWPEREIAAMKKDEAIAILNSVQPDKDKFELDDRGFGLAFPCCVCVHCHGSDKDEPCISCGHNLRSEE